jgi:hypothetical protein
LLAAFALLLIFCVSALAAGDAVEISTKPAKDASAPVGQPAADESPAPPTVADDTAVLDSAVQGDSVSVSTKDTQPTSKQLSLPLAEGSLYMEAYDSLEFDRNAGIAILSGDALVVLGDMQLEADYIEVNQKTKNLYVKGNVALQQDDDVMYADEGYYSYGTTEFSFVNVSGNMSGAQVNGAVYYKADEAKGNFKEFDMWNVWVTTCPPNCKVYEYEIRARKARVRRDSSIMLHYVYIYARESKIFFIPEFALPIRKFRPLQQTESPIRQNYGYNTTEGYFAKFAYTYANTYKPEIDATLLGTVLLAMTQKQGPGFGLRQDFASALGITTMRGFYQRQLEGDKDTRTGEKLPPTSNYNFELLQDLNFSPEFKGDFSIKRNNDVLAYRGRTNTWNNQFKLGYTQPNTSISLNGTHSINISSSTTSGSQSQQGTRSTNENLTFNYMHAINRLTDLSISQNVSGSKTSGSGPMNLEGDFRGELDYNRPDYKVSLRYEEEMDLDGDRYTGDDQQQITGLKPGLMLQLNRAAFGDDSVINGMTFNLDNVIDKRRNDKTTMPVLRFKYNTRLSRTFQNEETTFTPSLEFTQFMYGDGNAQYWLSPSANFRYSNNDWFSGDIQWSGTRIRGVKEPPVRSDRRTSSQSSSFGMEFKNDPWWKMNFRSSYDFHQMTWGQVSATWTANPSQDITFSVRNTWSPENKTFGTMTADATYWAPSNNWSFDTNVTMDVQGYSPKDKLFPVSSLRWNYQRRYKRGWNFYVYSNQTRGSKGALFDRVQIQKRNTCTTLNMGYSYQRKEFYLNFFINAFPRFPTSISAAEQMTDDWDFNFSAPGGDLFDVQRGLTGGWGDFAGYYQ